MKTIVLQLDADAITLQVGKDGNGIVGSTLHVPENDPDMDAETRAEYNAAIDGIESLVLAHACAGVNVEDTAYVSGLRVALESIANHIA